MLSYSWVKDVSIALNLQLMFILFLLENQPKLGAEISRVGLVGQTTWLLCLFQCWVLDPWPCHTSMCSTTELSLPFFLSFILIFETES